MNFLIENADEILKTQKTEREKLWKFDELCKEMLKERGSNYVTIRKFCIKNFRSAPLWDIEKVFTLLKSQDPTLDKEWSLNYIAYFKKYYEQFPNDNLWNKEMINHYNKLSDGDKAYYKVLSDLKNSIKKNFKRYTVKDLCDIIKKNEKFRQAMLINLMETW